MSGVLWEGKPRAISFVKHYTLALAPLILLSFSPKMLEKFPPWLKAPLSALASLLGSLGLAVGEALLLSWILTVGLGVLIWVFETTLKPLLYYVTLIVVAELAPHYYHFLTREFTYLLICAVALVAVDTYRRGFKYIITHDAVVIRGGLVSRIERSVILTSLADIIVVKPLIGRVAGYGHVIPVTASQLGLGDTASIAGVGAGSAKSRLSVLVGGWRSIRTVRPSPLNSVYGVSRPEEVRNLILRAAGVRST